ncbi:MAG TPA: DUF5667 domain-containing protein [Candidatus Methanoperedens sp.]|nr:DUF5667 domain-containing protein [Candidatus Methanoperedens sp.]
MKRVLFVFFVIVGSLGILMVSLSRATLEAMIRDETEDKLRVIPVIFDDKMIYKLPQTNMLPDNFMYGIKEARDWLWLKFSFNTEREAKTMLILADKRIAEAMALSKNGKQKLSFEASKEAVNKLKYANGLVSEMKNQPIAQQQLSIQIRDAIRAYGEIIKKINYQESDNDIYILWQQIDDIKKDWEQKETEKNKEIT